MSSSSMSKDELEAQHKKEIKALDGEKRAAIKKAKGTKGKKAKDAVAGVEAEYEKKLEEMKARHASELQNLEGAAAGSGAAGEGGGEGNAATSTNDGTDIGEGTSDGDAVDTEEERQRKKAEKARKKREKAREKEREREARIAEETANAGPSPRDVENDIIQRQLLPQSLAIQEVDADGHCLYRAVAKQCRQSDYQQMRTLCADSLLEHQEYFAPFCDYTDDIPDFACYVDRVRNSADWGGHLELRALSMALKRPMLVYSAQSSEPLVIDDSKGEDVMGPPVTADNAQDPIRLSYHLKYYALGEHYNQVVSLK